MSVPLQQIVEELDKLLRHHEGGQDWPAAKNGLQVECRTPISRIAAAVDATLPVIQKAIALRTQLLLVHHGLFWSSIEPLRGIAYEKVRLCILHNLAIYSSHLPLDAHEQHGNAVGLLRAISLPKGEPFLECKGWKVGRLVDVDLSVQELLERCQAATGTPPRLVNKATDRVGRLAVVTGSASELFHELSRYQVQTFLSGEGPHWTAGLAEELEINLIYAGHYATETFGVCSVAAWCAQRWGIDYHFIDHPSGL